MNDRVVWTIALSLSSLFWWNLSYGAHDQSLLSLKLRTQYCWLKIRKWALIRLLTASNKEIYPVRLDRISIRTQFNQHCRLLSRTAVKRPVREREITRDEKKPSISRSLLVKKDSYWIQLGHFTVIVMRTTISDEGAHFLFHLAM